MKRKVYDTSLTDSIRQRTALYDAYQAPKANVEEYFHTMENSHYEGAPDDFGVTDWVSNAFNDWNLKRNEAIRDSALGDYVMADQDYNTILNAKNYIQAVRDINTILPQLRQDPANKDLKQQVKLLSDTILNNKEAYNNILNDKLNDSSLNTKLKTDFINGNWNSALSEIDRQTTEQIDKATGSYSDPNTLYARKSQALVQADIAQNNADEYNSKLTSDYYRRKSQQPGMDLTDIDTYLFKMPGLMGSSAATITNDILTTGTTYAATLIGSSFGPIGTAVGMTVGAGAAIVGNLFSRERESKGEVYSNYKTSVLNQIDKSGISKQLLKEARAEMQRMGSYTQEQIDNDDYVYNQLLTNQVKVNNVKFDKIRLNNFEGMKSLYTDNMALSAWDATQTMLEVVPLGKMAKSVRGLKTIAEKYDKGKGFLKGEFAKRIDDVASFGIDSVDKLPKITKRKAVLDLGGRILISSAMEGAEEGTQYMKGQDYIDRHFEENPNLAKSFIKNIGSGARSIFAAITPWDSVYSDDAEFMENFKGGALLGGLMTGGIGAATSYLQTRDQLQADKLLSALYAEKLDQKDRVRKDIVYAEMAANNKWDNLMQSFDNLQSANIDGLTQEDIETERNNANRVKNIATSQSALKQAEALGIEPNTEDYNILIALKDHYDKLVEEADQNFVASSNKMQSLLNGEEVNKQIEKVISKLSDEQRSQISVEDIRNAISLYSELEVYNRLINDYEQNSTKLNDLEKNAGIRTSKADVIHFRNLLNTDKKALENSYDKLKKVLSEYNLTESDFQVPSIHQDLADAQEQLILSSLDQARAREENNLMSSDDKKSIMAKINKWKNSEAKEDDFVQDIEDLYSGRTQEKVAEEGEEVTPEPLKQKPAPVQEQEKPQEDEDIKSARQNAKEIQNEFFTTERDSRGNSKVVLNTNNEFGQAYKQASDALRESFISQHPNVKNYSEYVAASQMDRAEGQEAERWQEIYDLRNQLEEEVYNNGNSDKAKQLVSQLKEAIENKIDSNLLKEAYNDFVSSGEWKISQNLQNREKARAEELKLLAQEVREEIAQREQQNIQNKEKEAQKPITIPSETPTPVSPVEEAPKTEPLSIEDVPTLSDILGGWLGDEAKQALETPNQVIKEQQVTEDTATEPRQLEELTYDSRLDPYSHELNYRLTDSKQNEQGQWIRVPKKFQGMEQYLNNEEFSEVSGQPDFIKEVTKNGVRIVVRPYTKGDGTTTDAIYALFNYKGKEYVASIKTVEGLYARGNRAFNRLPFNDQQLIVNNLSALRNKVLELNKQVQSNPNLQIVPTTIRKTNGRIVNLKNEDGSPKNRNLTESSWLTVKDPYEINSENTQIGITTGGLGGNVIRFKNQVISAKGFPMGKPVWMIKTSRDDGSSSQIGVVLNYGNFKDKPEVADLIINLVTSKDQFYTDANGTVTNITPQNVLQFLVNFGPQTATNPNDTRLSPEQVRAKMAKQFYLTEDNQLVVGQQVYNLNDITTVPEIRERLKNYIMDNFHWNIDESGLSSNYLGGDLQSQVKDPKLYPLALFLKNNNVDKITLIPNVLEFTNKDFGITKDSNGNKQVDSSHPNGISVLGWYIKQGILLTDIADTLQDANIYIDDVMLVDKTAERKIEQSQQKVQEETKRGSITLPDETGKQTTIDLDEIFSILDGKGRKGPNMEVTEKEVSELAINSQNKMNPEQAKEWIQSTLGITPEIVSSVIDVTEAGNIVVGRVTEDSIKISEQAPEGVQYHEAWHRVSQLLIDPKHRNRIYKKYRDQGLTDKQIDEKLADQFKDFMLNESGNYRFDTKNWFRRIYDFIKLWIRTGQYGLAKIYSAINRGKYYGLKPSTENVARFREIYKGEGANMEVSGYKFKHIQTVKQLNDIINSLTYAFFQVSFTDGKTINYSDLSKEAPKFDRLKLILQAQAYKYPSDVINEVVEKFDSIILPMLTVKLKQLGIRAVDRNENDTISNIEEGTEGVNIGQHTVEGMNISIRDNAPAEVKFFFQTIPAYEIGKDGTPQTKFDEYTHFPSFVDPNIAWTNILKDLSGCRTISNIIDKVQFFAKNGDTFYQALLLRLTTLVKNSLSADTNVATQAEAMLTRIETVITSDINNYITVKISEDAETGFTRMELKDNTIDVKAANYPRVWSQYLFNNSGIFKYNESGAIVATDNAKQTLRVIIDNFNRIRNAFTNNKGLLRIGDNNIDLHEASNQEYLKDIIIRMMNSVGIGIDKPTLNRMLLSGDYGNPRLDQYTLLNSFLVNRIKFGGVPRLVETLENIKNSINKDNTISPIKVAEESLQPTQIWNTSGFIKEIANYYAYQHATDKSLSSYGPDGNSYYMVSQNNFAKDRLNEIVNDKDTFDNLNSVVYNGNSIILNSVKSGNKDLSVETLINFKDTTSQDAGRDYFGITDREDYLAKMVAVFNDRIIFPTVADKKTYHFIKGIRLPHERINFNVTPQGSYIKYGEQSMDTLLGYCYDELNQIELCLRQIDDDPTHYDEKTGLHYNDDGTINNDWLEPSRRIKNFHTPNKVSWKDKNGKKHSKKLEGNGARFLLLTGINTSKGFISFNDPMKSAKENLQTAKDYFFNLSKDTQKAFLSSLINQRVKQEIATAKELGLIEGNENNDIWSLRNKLLDDIELNNRKSFYSQLDPTNAEGYAIFDMLADYTINSIISINEVEKLFSGAPAYYKVKYDEYGPVDVSIDKIKRLGSLTSTGLNNRLDFFNDPIRDEYVVAELKDHEIMDKQYYIYEGLFTRGNIKETIQELEGEDAWNEVKDLSIQEIEKIYPESVKIAKQAAKAEVEGYKGGINVADAAVYISPNMTRDLLRMRGVWSPEIKKAFDILTNEDTANLWDSDPKLYAEANKVILNAMKYMAFGTRFNEIPGLGIPYFNKMALFPLFKSIATGDIKALYDRMTDPSKPVDMVLFDSAVKAGSRSPMKFYRVAKDSEIELRDGQTVLSAKVTDELINEEGNTLNDFNNLVTYTQKFKYLRQQLETNPHTHEEQMAGTQFMKVNLSNLRMDDLYGIEGKQVTGREIKDTIMNALNKLSDMGVQDLKDELFNKDGSVNVTKLAKMLEDDARESDANDNVLSGLKTANNQFIIPLSSLSDNKWLESRFISMINKQVIDVHIPGGAFIQRSTLGLEATSTKVITPNMINDGRVLKSINEEGSMDSVVSINLFKYFIPNYENLTYREARQWLIDHEIIGDKATANAIGYRIPTQSIASISPLRFVDVFPEIMGDTIMLPEDFTKLTGSDFDIDKLYVARFSYNNKGVKITKGNALKYEDVRSSIKNEMLDAYMKVLLTKDNTNSLKLSIDNATENVKEVLRDIEGPSSYHPTPFEVYSPTYQEARKAEYTGGKAGIGPFALNNAHHILTQLTKLSMVRNEFTSTLDIWNIGGIYDTPVAGMKKGGRILDWLSAMINGFVDIAKDPYIVRLNVNSWTYNMVSFLLRTGKGKQTFYFVAQPILKEMAEAVIKTKGKYGIDRTKTPTQLENEAIESVLDKYDPTKKYRKKYEFINGNENSRANEYRDLFSTYQKENGEYTSRTRELLKLNKEEISNFNEEQVRIYYAWRALKPYADSLANLVKYSKVDTKKTGKTFAEQQTYYNGMWAMTEDVNFANGEIERFYKDTFIAKKTENSIPFGTSIFKNLLLRNTDTFLSKKDIMLSLLGRKNNADSKLLNALISGMEAQIKSGFFNQFIYQNGIDINGMFTGKMSMAKRINNFKHEILKGNPKLSRFLNNDGTINNDFINYLIPNIDYNGLDFIDTSSLLDSDQSQANNLINYWRELLEDPEPKVSQLFKDLVVYAFITSGDNPTMNSFFQYVPNSYKMSIGYTDYIQTKLDELSNGVDQSIVRDDLFLNNWQNDKLVKPVDLYNKKGAKLYSISLNDQSVVPNIIMGERQDKTDKPAIRPSNWLSMTYVNAEGKLIEGKFPIFYPYIKINDGLGHTPANYHVYSLIGYKQAVDPDTKRLNYIPIYGLVSKKGYKYRGHTVVEYGKESQFDFNRENVWDYTEALQNQEALADMSDEYSKPNWQNSNIHLITDLPPYQNMNYAKEQQDMVFEWKQDDKDESEQGIVLSETDKTENVASTVSPVTKIISGGQTGIDRLGLEVGRELGIETGGTTTPGYYTEIGRDESLKDFGVIEISPELQQGRKGKEFYLPRTEQNVINSDGTVYFATNEDSAGKLATKRFADKHNKPFLLNPKSGEELRNWLIRNNIKTLNVAGNRGSKIGTLRDTAYKVLIDALKPKSIQLNLFANEVAAIQQVKEYLTELSKDNTDLAARKTYKGFITQLKDNQIFVFGSNTQGRHGKGAALIARNKFGAIYGQAEGPQGQSYAIITKDLTKSIHPSRTKEQITQQIHDLYEYARNNPDKEFLVAYSGTGTNLNAYSNKEMADMFSSEVIPNNIMFEDEFNSLLNERNWVDAKIEEFTQLLRKENPTTPEEVEGLINKFICNL